MATSYLTYDDFQPKIFPNMPGWVFNNPFQSFEQVGTGIEQAYQASLQRQKMEDEAKLRADKMAALEQAKISLRDNPDILTGGNMEAVDKALLGPMAQAGDIDEVMKILERRDKRTADEEYRKQQQEAQKETRRQQQEYRDEMLGLRREGLDLQRESVADRRANRKPPSDGYKDKVVDVISPQGTKETRKVSTVDEELRLRQQGYTILDDDPMNQAFQLQQLGLTPEQVRMVESRGTPMPSATPQPSPSPGVIGQALDNYRPRNGPRRFRAVPVR